MAGGDIRFLRPTGCRRCGRVFTHPAQHEFIPLEIEDRESPEYGKYELVCKRPCTGSRPYTPHVERMREARDFLDAAIRSVEENIARFG